MGLSRMFSYYIEPNGSEEESHILKGRLSMFGRSTKIYIVLLGVTVLLGYNVGTVLALDYNGTGHFSDNVMNWCHTGAYSNENGAAIFQWDAGSDIIVGANGCNQPEVITSAVNFGGTGVFGYAYICSGTQCNNQAALDGTYTYCNAQSNNYYLDYWTWSERKYMAMHELGHCWSLGHRYDTSTTVMRDGKYTLPMPDYRDNQLVNARH